MLLGRCLKLLDRCLMLLNRCLKLLGRCLMLLVGSGGLRGRTAVWQKDWSNLPDWTNLIYSTGSNRAQASQDQGELGAWRMRAR